MTIPYICLFSTEDGTPEEMKAYQNALEANSQDTYIETFQRQHGWMDIRCDFKDETAKSEFNRAYGKIAEFFDKYL